MAVFFVYSHDGQECSTADMEYSPNAEGVRRELASRVRTGKGRSCLVSDLPEVSWRGARETYTEDEWPDATEDAYMAVWRCRSGEKPSGAPTEIWQYSGAVDRPVITSVDTTEKISAFGERKTLDEWATDERMRVPVSIFTRRIEMGWAAERALNAPLGHRSGTIRETSKRGTANRSDFPDGKTPAQREVHYAFGMKHTMAEWSEITGINRSTLWGGARRMGLAEYLRSKQWYPERRKDV